jgi:cell wall-associated NlpC family hydrolase
MCPSSPISDPIEVRQRVIQEARKLIGTPFRHFGRTRHGLDCSGVIYLTYNRAGLSLPQTDGHAYQCNWFEFEHANRLVDALSRYFERMPNDDSPLPGDILLFQCYNLNAMITHSGICINFPTFVHARSGGRVELTSVKHRFWGSKYAGHMRFKGLI